MEVLVELVNIKKFTPHNNISTEYTAMTDVLSLLKVWRPDHLAGVRLSHLFLAKFGHCTDCKARTHHGSTEIHVQRFLPGRPF